jgi:hypothetical protein
MILEFTCNGNRMPYFRHRATLRRSAWGHLYLTVESMDSEYRCAKVEMGPLAMWEKGKFPLIEKALRVNIPEHLREELERDLDRDQAPVESTSGLTLV